MSLSRPRGWGEDDGCDGGSGRSPPAKRPRSCCRCCPDTRDFYEKQMELLKKEMRCMSQEHKKGLESIRREMQELYKTINQKIGEMGEGNQRKQQNHLALMAEISRSHDYVQQSPGPRMSFDQDCITSFQFKFQNSCSNDKYSKHEIKADNGTHLKVAIYDNNNTIVTYEPFSSMGVQIVAIHGNFDNSQKGRWTKHQFLSSVVPGRPQKESLLCGKLQFRLQNGVGYLNGVKFQDNSSFVPSKMFKLAVMADDERITERIKEGITESFPVKDSRGFSSKKNPYPSPSDPVYKLKRIAVNGDRRKSLESNNIKTVEDFLCSYGKDEKNLREILGNISDHDWKTIVDHAHKCNTTEEVYSNCIVERDMSDEQVPILRNRNNLYLQGSCSVQPTVQACVHGSLEEINVRVMNQQLPSTYNGLSSGVPLKHIPSESSLQPNEHLGVIHESNHQISSTGNELQSVASMATTLERSTSPQRVPLECSEVHDVGNKLPSCSSAESTLKGSNSLQLQANPPQQSTVTTGGHPRYRGRWLYFVTTIIVALNSWKKDAASSRLIVCGSNDPVHCSSGLPLDDDLFWQSFLVSSPSIDFENV